MVWIIVLPARFRREVLDRAQLWLSRRHPGADRLQGSRRRLRHQRRRRPQSLRAFFHC